MAKGFADGSAVAAAADCVTSTCAAETDGRAEATNGGITRPGIEGGICSGCPGRTGGTRPPCWNI